MAGSIFANDDTGAITFLDGLNVQNPYRGSGTGVTSGLASSVVVTMPSGTVNNDGLLAAITFIQGTTITPPAGWTAIDSSTGSSGVTLNTYYRVASSEPGSYTWNFGTTTTAAGTISRFVGINTTTMLDTFVSVNGHGSATSVQPTSTLSQKSATNLAVIFSGVRPDSGVTPVLTMPSSVQWTAPADAAATATGVSFPSVQGMAYKINGTTFTPTVTTNTACEFGLTTISLNVSSRLIYETDASAVGGSGLTADYSDSANWTIGSTSAFPSNGPINPGDGKLDYISTASAPTSVGVFSADLGAHSPKWDADLATTEFSTGNFQLKPGDTVSTTVTLGSDQGAWPAIWTWSSDNSIGGNNEVDLFEYHPDNPNLLELSNHVGGTTTFKYVDGIVTAGTPFDLRVYFGLNSCRWYVNNVLVFDDNKGVPSNWRANLIVNMSVSDGSSHPAPAGGQTHMQFSVANLKVLRSAGAFTEASTEAVTTSASDTGAGTDLNTALHEASTTTDVSSSLEATTTSATLSTADTSSSLEATTIAATAASSDVSSSVDAQGDPRVSDPVSDTGTGTEATSLHAALSTSDSGLGTEANTLQATQTQTDTGSSTEANTLTARMTQTESSSTVENAVIAVASSDSGAGLDDAKMGIAASDTSSSVDTSTTLHVALSSSDTGLGTDTNTALHEAATSADTSSSVEATIIAVALTASETGNFTETELVGVPLSSADTFTGTDSAALLADVPSSDTASSLESSILMIPTADSMTGVDSEVVASNFTSADTVGATEFSFTFVALSDSDTGSFDDEASGGLVDPDFGTFAELENVNAAISSSDSITGTDVGVINVNDSDSVSASENTVVGPRGSDASGTPVETASVRVAVIATDTGSGTESANTIRAAIHEADSFTYSEDSGITFFVSDTDTFSGFDDAVSPATALSDGDAFTGIEDVGPIVLTGVLDSMSAVESESGGDRIFSSDASTPVSEGASIRVGFTDTVSFNEVGVIHVSSSDSFVGIDASGPQGIRTSDFGLFSEVGKIAVRFSDSISLIDSALLRLTFPTDTGSATESASKFEFGIPINSSDTGHASEAWALKIFSAADSLHGTDSHRIGVSGTDTWDPDEVATISFHLTDSSSSTEGSSVVSGPPHDGDTVHFAEGASIVALNLGGVPHLGPRLNPLAPIQPYYLRRQQRWAVDNERQRHLQALYMYGEWTMFVLMWHIEDFNANLVDKCHRCFGVPGEAKTPENRRSAAYGNVNEYRCPNCFGTTFEGGFKSIIVRPAIFGDTDESQQYGERGVSNPGELDVESTPDFRVRSGDYSFRSTGDRYFLRVPDRVTLRTGFATPYQRTDAIGYNHAKAAIADPTAVAYSLPPSPEDLVSILNVQGSYTPVDFSAFEIIRSPLIPVSEDQG